jgi:23S rRNA (cytidine1920-2'-O)/16S rRNA (cytidine1409-2'-O)-methyltransferase
VFCGDRRIEKSGEQIRSDAPLRIRDQPKYVSRGGIKLEGALSDSGFDPAQLIAADVGASTGGFTDCLLARGVTKVFAIDVGQGQLAEKLRQDPRVIVMERTNARHLTADQVDGGVDLCVVDASFISLHKLLPALHAIIRPNGHLLALIKPQFEVGREEATRTEGVISDPRVRANAISLVLGQVTDAGFAILSDHTCRLAGPKGNVEHFVLASRL